MRCFVAAGYFGGFDVNDLSCLAIWAFPNIVSFHDHLKGLPVAHATIAHLVPDISGCTRWSDQDGNIVAWPIVRHMGLGSNPSNISTSPPS